MTWIKYPPDNDDRLGHGLPNPLPRHELLDNLQKLAAQPWQRDYNSHALFQTFDSGKIVLFEASLKALDSLEFPYIALQKGDSRMIALNAINGEKLEKETGHAYPYGTAPINLKSMEMRATLLPPGQQGMIR